MKNKNLINLFLCGILFSLTQTTHGEETPVNLDKFTDQPQVLDGNETSTTPNTEVVPTIDKVEAKSNEANAEVDLELKNDKKSKKANVLTEDELLKASTIIAPPKVKSKKITESEMFIQEADKYKLADIYKTLKLNDVIEQGMRKNYDQEIRNKKENLSELVFDSYKDSFWYPNIKLTLSTDSQMLSLIRKSSRSTGTNNPQVPGGYLGLSIGDYTIFNWGKDYALYLNTKNTFVREKEKYNEAKRELRLNLIYNFFNLLTTKNIEKIRQDQLRHASFLYRLNKEKITIGKISQQDYYQARSEYLKAQNDFHESKMQSDIADENMSYYITDSVGTKYNFTEALDYKRIKINLEDSVRLASTQNPTLLDNQTALSNAERSYDIAQKENMPLPKISLNLGAYDKTFGPTTNKTLYETANGNGNIELVASINATWDLVGANGFLNSTKLATSRVTRELANFELYKNKHYTETNVHETYKNILSYQNQMLILEARVPNIQKTFDTILENYLNGKTKYYDFHIALIELTETKIALENTKLNHLKEKLTLAKLIGVEDFPGENFELLALKVKGK
jgi:outer membrane protein TolC